jgi:inhibitor of KinA
MSSAWEWRLVPVGESVVVVEFEERIDRSINDRAVSLARRMRAAGVPGIRDVVPTFRSVAVYFDPLQTDYETLIRRLEGEIASLDTLAQNATTGAIAEPIRVPVCYGGEFGPDLPEVAAFGGVTESEAARLHASAVYRVFMIGFLPGFAYMGTVDPRIAAPRRPNPRTRVPAGSVAIAGLQTGIYPSESPGGWQLIGRTSLPLFDPSRAKPSTFAAGDLVRFYPVSPVEAGL